MSLPAADLNLIGFLSSNLGLGVVARRWERALRVAGLRVRSVDIPAPGGRRLPGPARSPDARSAPGPIDLLVLNPPEVTAFERQGLLGRPGRSRAIVPFWELERLPAGWVPVLEKMDRVVASSGFIEATLARDLPPVSIVRVVPPLPEVQGIRGDRTRFGLPAGAVVFATTLEVASDTGRKNPWAVLEAFDRAFAGRRNAHLTIKLNNPDGPEASNAVVDRLRRRIASLPRASLLERTLGDEEMLAWLASSDVFVSLHRAEGLGLPLLESMALGVPVIATAWSGNLEFTTPGNSALVGFRRVAVAPETQEIYAGLAGATWADPDVDEAARWMRALAEDAELRRTLGERARSDVAMHSGRNAAARLIAALAPLGLSNPPAAPRPRDDRPALPRTPRQGLRRSPM